MRGQLDIYGQCAAWRSSACTLYFRTAVEARDTGLVFR
jgi:hypothetical protein